jgi:hypothetical protein
MLSFLNFSLVQRLVFDERRGARLTVLAETPLGVLLESFRWSLQPDETVWLGSEPPKVFLIV